MTRKTDAEGSTRLHKVSRCSNGCGNQSWFKDPQGRCQGCAEEDDICTRVRILHYKNKIKRDNMEVMKQTHGHKRRKAGTDLNDYGNVILQQPSMSVGTLDNRVIYKSIGAM